MGCFCICKIILEHNALELNVKLLSSFVTPTLSVVFNNNELNIHHSPQPGFV